MDLFLDSVFSIDICVLYLLLIDRWNLYSLFDYFILWVKYYSITHLLLINIQNTSIFATTIKECFNFCFCKILSPEWANGLLTAQFSLKYCELLGQTCIHNAGNLGSVPALGRSPGEGNGNPLQYCCPLPPKKGAQRNIFEKEMATHFSVPAWRIPGMGDPRGLPSMGSHRVGHDWSDLAAAGQTCIF